MASSDTNGSKMERALKNPHLSICIPTYSEIEYLRKTLTSIQEQDYTDYELIISDDTPDETVARLVDSFNFGNKVKYYRNTISLGSPENWNAAVRRAKGDYIKIMHHDDRFDNPGSLSTFVRLLDDHPEVNFAFGSSRVEDIINGKSRIHRPSSDRIAEISARPEALFFGNIIGAPSATIYRRGLDIEYDTRMKWLVDIDFYIRILQQNKRFAYTSEVLIITPTNAVHQVTEICKSSAEIEIYEYLLLYHKIYTKLPNFLSSKKLQNVWFGLFEKYRIYSLKEFYRLDIKLSSAENTLKLFFSAYRRASIRRAPYRVYSSLPNSLKNKIRKIININLI